MNVTSTGVSAWADASSTYTYSQTIGPNDAPSNNARWEMGSGQIGTITNSLTISPEYFDQDYLQASYSVTGGGSGYPSPQFNFDSFGNSSSVALQTSPEGYWIDSGSSWSVSPKTLNGSSSPLERWSASNSSSFSGIANSSNPVIDPNYVHQYFVNFTVNTPLGGSVQNESGWYGANQSIPISATAQNGWKLFGWSGGGQVTNSTGSELLLLNGPANETAVFYAPIVLSASANGQISYSTNATSGMVGAGSSETIFVAPGTSISLSATSSSMLYSFGGWSISGNNASSSSPSFTVDISGPASVGASFSLSFTIIALLACASIAVVATVGILVSRGGKAKEFLESSAHNWKW